MVVLAAMIANSPSIVDILVFATVTALAWVAAVIALRRRGMTGQFLGLFGLAYFGMMSGGWFLISQAGTDEQNRIRHMLEGYVPTYAQEMEMLGHENVTASTAADDPGYLRMIDAEKRWLRANAAVSDIYTFRRSPEGKWQLIVDSETDYDHSGAIDQEREERTAIGEDYDEPDALPALARCQDTGSVVFDDRIVVDRWGSWVSAYAPIRDAAGRVDAVLGVDFDSAQWQQAIRRARRVAMVYVAAILALVIGAAALLARTILSRQRAAAESERRARELGERKFEALVNSLDAVVWERELGAAAYAFVSPQVERILGWTPVEWLRPDGPPAARLHPEDADAPARAEAYARAGRPYSLEYRLRARDGRVVWIRESAAVQPPETPGAPATVRGVFLDITQQREDAAELEQTHQALQESSRLAGMAEVATGVLHNVGNVLNSVNVSGAIIEDRLKKSRLADLEKISSLVAAQQPQLADFLTTDPRGRALPTLIHQLTGALREEHAAVKEEVRIIVKHIAHIKHIVSLQQSFARGSAVMESLEMHEVVEEALRMHSSSLTRHGVAVTRVFADVPPVTLDRHKTLQILVNLVRNAKQAMRDNPHGERHLLVRIRQTGQQTVAVEIQDNGSGISPENLDRIFSHGFTTKASGHGFGLHSCALQAQDMDGRLTAASAGPGRGATFTLELPLSPFVEAAPASAAPTTARLAASGV